MASASSPGLSLCLSFLLCGHGAEPCAGKEKKKRTVIKFVDDTNR